MGSIRRRSSEATGGSFWLSPTMLQAIDKSTVGYYHTSVGQSRLAERAADARA